MKKVTTLLCAIAFMISGIQIAKISQEGIMNSRQNTLSAATIPRNEGFEKLPLDIQLDLEKRQITDTIKLIDTVYVSNPKVAKVHQPKRPTDFLVMAFTPERVSKEPVSSQVMLGREEQPKDVDVGTSKASTIQLIVDGQTVYTKNDNHSAGEGQ